MTRTIDLPDSLLDYPVDTSRAIAKLHYSNTFARTPDDAPRPSTRRRAGPDE